MAYTLIPSSTDFQAVRDGILSLPLYFDVDLSIARSKANGTAAVYEVAGNSLFQDQDVAGGGICKITFQHRDFGIADPAFTSAPGFQAAVPFTRLLIENAAQAAKTARIFYGVDLDFKPASVGVVQITGGVSVAQAGSISERTVTGASNTIITLVAFDPTRRRLIVRNTHSSAPLYIGSATVNTSPVIILGPNDIWVEDSAAVSAWYGYGPSVTPSFTIQEAF